MPIVLAVVLSSLIGYAIGWCVAYADAAKKCRRLGRFYVGMETFYVDKISHLNDGKGGIPPMPTTKPNRVQE